VSKADAVPAPEIETVARVDESLPPRIQAVADLVADVIARRLRDGEREGERAL
jgi:hypothetical protein